MKEIKIELIDYANEPYKGKCHSAHKEQLHAEILSILKKYLPGLTQIILRTEE